MEHKDGSFSWVSSYHYLLPWEEKNREEIQNSNGKFTKVYLTDDIKKAAIWDKIPSEFKHILRTVTDGLIYHENDDIKKIFKMNDDGLVRFVKLDKIKRMI